MLSAVVLNGPSKVKGWMDFLIGWVENFQYTQFIVQDLNPFVPGIP